MECLCARNASHNHCVSRGRNAVISSHTSLYVGSFCELIYLSVFCCVMSEEGPDFFEVLEIQTKQAVSSVSFLCSLPPHR